MRYLKYFAMICVCVVLQAESEISMDATGSEVEDEWKTTETLESLQKVTDYMTRLALEYCTEKEHIAEKLNKFLLKIAMSISMTPAFREDFFAAVDKVAKDNIMLGLDILDCTQNKEDELRQVVASFSNATEYCIAGKLDEAIGNFSGILLNMEMANDILKSLIQKKKICKDHPSEDHCGKKVRGVFGEEIGEAKFVVPPNVMNDILKAKATVHETESNLLECYYSYNEELERKSEKIWRGIWHCMREKRLIIQMLQLVLKDIDGDPQRKESSGVKSGGLGGHSTLSRLPRPIWKYLIMISYVIIYCLFAILL